jgi:hypothetical protein
MTSIYERPAVSPAELTRRLIKEAQEAAIADEWAQYEEENRRHNEIRNLDGVRRYKTIQHGTRAGYSRGCDCTPCMEANNEWMRDYRHRKGINKPMDSRRGRNWKHGTMYGYQHCGPVKCEPCKEARRAYDDKHRNAELRRVKRATDEQYRLKANAKKREWLNNKRASDPEWAERERQRVRDWRAERRGKNAKVSQQREDSTENTLKHSNMLQDQTRHDKETL